jgi:uncharacterized membrane protein HdeD (DUF308 family)
LSIDMIQCDGVEAIARAALHRWRTMGVNMATASELNAPGDRNSGTRPAGGWQVAWGVLLIISGVVAMAMPAAAALATALLFAWLLIVSGGVELAYAIQTRAWPGFGWKLASGILTLLLGIAILWMPLAGVASLAMLVGAFLFVGGITRIALAFKLKPQRGWGWVLFDGLLSVVLAALIAFGWPESSVAFIGLLAGFWLIWAGLWRILLRPASPA